MPKLHFTKPIVLTLLLIVPYLASAQDAGTIITSERMEMVSEVETNTFFFQDNVKIIGNNLIATADKMKVISLRTAEEEESIGQIGQIQEILLEGNVTILQAGREATCEKAKVDPMSGKVILEGNPVVRDAQVVVTGYRIELYKGERKARVFNDPNADDQSGRPTVTLPTLPDIGFDQDK